MEKIDRRTVIAGAVSAAMSSMLPTGKVIANLPLEQQPLTESTRTDTFDEKFFREERRGWVTCDDYPPVPCDVFDGDGVNQHPIRAVNIITGKALKGVVFTDENGDQWQSWQFVNLKLPIKIVPVNFGG